MAHLRLLAVTVLSGRGKGSEMIWVLHLSGSGTVCGWGEGWGFRDRLHLEWSCVSVVERVETVRRGPELVHQQFASLLGQVYKRHCAT